LRKRRVYPQRRVKGNLTPIVCIRIFLDCDGVWTGDIFSITECIHNDGSGENSERGQRPHTVLTQKGIFLRVPGRVLADGRGKLNINGCDGFRQGIILQRKQGREDIG
jgi:hypothetical protein